MQAWCVAGGEGSLSNLDACCCRQRGERTGVAQGQSPSLWPSHLPGKLSKTGPRALHAALLGRVESPPQPLPHTRGGAHLPSGAQPLRNAAKNRNCGCQETQVSPRDQRKDRKMRESWQKNRRGLVFRGSLDSEVISLPCWDRVPRLLRKTHSCVHFTQLGNAGHGRPLWSLLLPEWLE